jgi:hypothetical protein
LTKPFQSIRRLIDKVGELVTVKPPETEVPTAELPDSPHELEEPRLSAAELEITTADTMKLPEEFSQPAIGFSPEPVAPQPVVAPTPTKVEPKMDTRRPRVARNTVTETSDTLLDLGDLEPTEVLEADDFELELDDVEPAPTPAPAPAPFVAPAVAKSQVAVSPGGWEAATLESPIAPETVLEVEPVGTQAVAAQVAVAAEEFKAHVSQTITTPTRDTQELSQEMIEVIARRAVELLSEKVVQEIAWEVVPQLAELMIKRQLEESQPK